MSDKKKCCKECSFLTKFKYQPKTGYCDKRKRVVGRTTNFFPEIMKDFCNYFFVRKK